MSATRRLAFLGLAFYFTLGSQAWGCVACGSAAARHLRHTLVSSDFVPTLLTVIAPFPVLLLAALGLCRWLAGAPAGRLTANGKSASFQA